MAVYDKELLKNELIAALAEDSMVNKIVIFGSFITSSTPHDMDVAVFCDSSESYLPIALSLRKKTSFSVPKNTCRSFADLYPV